ncbi:MAG: hypothetical protein DRP45_00605 [Candidatus Zixiibacteriota bacterium]|nr:MAG: hypothetical protein DRP45_00605 [candidate division Zixibacteria bacterium]
MFRNLPTWSLVQHHLVIIARLGVNYFHGVVLRNGVNDKEILPRSACFQLCLHNRTRWNCSGISIAIISFQFNLDEDTDV